MKTSFTFPYGINPTSLLRLEAVQTIERIRIERGDRGIGRVAEARLIESELAAIAAATARQSQAGPKRRSA